MNRMTSILINYNNFNVKRSISIVCILLAAATLLFSPHALSIPLSPGTGFAQEQEQQNIIIDLDDREDAESFRGINMILSALNYDAAINRANNVLKSKRGFFVREKT